MPSKPPVKPRSRSTGSARTVLLGLDMGGTNIKAGVVDASGRVLARTSIPTGDGTDLSPDAVTDRLALASRKATALAKIPLSQIHAIGVTSPGDVDPVKGVVKSAANFPGWRNVPLARKLAAELNTSAPVHLENDAKAAAYAEWWVGAGRRSKTMLIITLGTGVGGGIIHNGQLLRGTAGLAGEIGHMILFPGGIPCGCGQLGCVEQYCSAHYFAERTTQDLLRNPLLKKSSLFALLKKKGVITAEDIERHARKGDTFSRVAWYHLTKNLATTCINAARVIDPDVIVLAGGLAKAGAYLLKPVRKQFVDQWWKFGKPPATLRLTSLENHAGIIGAAGLALRDTEARS